MPMLWDELPGARLSHLMHDEILLEVPEDLADQAAALLLEVMQQDPGLEASYLKGVLLLHGLGAIRCRDDSGAHTALAPLPVNL